METFQALLDAETVARACRGGLPNAGEVTPATDARFGDYQTNAALILAKQRGENPRAARAEDHCDASRGHANLCEPPTIAGAGFINFTLAPEAVAAQDRGALAGRRLGVARADYAHNES